MTVLLKRLVGELKRTTIAEWIDAVQAGAARAAKRPRNDVFEGEVVPLVGFELTTFRLQGGCSTN